MKKQVRGNLLLIITSFIWGFAFVFQSKGMEFIGPFTFNSLRLIVGALVLLPFTFIEAKLLKKNNDESKIKPSIKKTIIGGLILGACIFLASSFQQVGIVSTSAGKAGFITSLYIVFVPIIGLFFKRKFKISIIPSLIIALIGMYLLCVKGNFDIAQGDLLVLCSALFFSFQILATDYFVKYVSPIKLSCSQFLVAGLLSLIPMTQETIVWSQISLALPSILYTGILSCGLAYTLQIMAQKDINPTIACLIMSLESVFAVIGGVLILHEALTLKEGIGCVLLFIAIVIAQLEIKDFVALFKKNKIEETNKKIYK